jgi:hypothetical protein
MSGVPWRGYGSRRENKGYKRMNRNRAEEIMLFVEGKTTTAMLIGCWRFEKPYQKIDGRWIHIDWAVGEGEIVRHLCGESKCVNPLHLIRGTDIENAKDEIEVEEFSNELYAEMLNDRSLDNLERGLRNKVLVPRMLSKYRYTMGFELFGDVSKYAREMYRKNYIIEFRKRLSKKDIDEEVFKVQFERAKQLMNVLRGREDVKIIILPGGSDHE